MINHQPHSYYRCDHPPFLFRTKGNHITQLFPIHQFFHTLGNKNLFSFPILLKYQKLKTKIVLFLFHTSINNYFPANQSAISITFTPSYCHSGCLVRAKIIFGYASRTANRELVSLSNVFSFKIS